ncbi:hypothetical protein [Azospirillum agricola]|uniref:hypothetical protein n=1 Tax=Azospirillum agricola TaxID=1720247 RepID=UPI000A0EFD75|nr:hypothetical protein [Azospirillum agricola]SMH61942.1 hypothetical protein SAMN02982994_6064 [Azospirillum lipoferum]
MTDHALDGSEVLDGTEQDDPHAHKSESPWVVFPGLIFLLIMPLGIIFHPSWLAALAELGTLTMFIIIFRLTRL